MKLENQVVSLDLAKRLCSKCKKNPRHYSRKGVDASWCKPCLKKKNLRWYSVSPEKARASSKRWRLANREKNRLYKRRSNLKLRQAALDHYGRMCACCGETTEWFLAIDHMDNNGREHRRQMGYSNTYSWLRKAGYPKGFQTLCHNCNCAKGFYGHCPHTLLSNKKYGTFKAGVQSRTQQAA